MAELIIAENPLVQSVKYTLPNKHYVPVDMKYKGIDNLTPLSVSFLLLHLLFVSARFPSFECLSVLVFLLLCAFAEMRTARSYSPSIASRADLPYSRRCLLSSTLSHILILSLSSSRPLFKVAWSARGY